MVSAGTDDPVWMLIGEATRRDLMMGGRTAVAAMLANGLTTLGQHRPSMQALAWAHWRPVFGRGFPSRRRAFAQMSRVLGPSASRDRSVEGRRIAREPKAKRDGRKADDDASRKFSHECSVPASHPRNHARGGLRRLFV
jgi:hypothetical protein